MDNSVADSRGDEVKLMDMHRQKILKEERSYAEFRYAWKQSDVNPRKGIQERATYFKVPQRGEAVTLYGLKSRASLNGMQAEVIESSPADDGSISVRIRGGERKFRVHPSRLKPLPGASTSTLPSISLAPWCKQPAEACQSCLSIAAPPSSLGDAEMQALHQYLTSQNPGAHSFQRRSKSASAIRR
mmetsp:Transcript_107071/g.169227  ORF Transcript_107071/g.169227 Transcript_107071/m.169227 type:complete len:186 (-) Transcript_107071:40-597(-)|eukprot:CAMPEP_0169123308 /NCGR_PEP_ID=MMETSP1015-20121227/33715_1 /TAXON_ID=342587 /ORGANISM="Karlodinium micrum, Strain CCMP2283" /LENGTH=185 /DNA_ID=CAMNT_0009186635 /DNA_START=63 /DNA_END=620 /DNA_ORIENTATION=+